KCEHAYCGNPRRLGYRGGERNKLLKVTTPPFDSIQKTTYRLAAMHKGLAKRTSPGRGPKRLRAGAAQGASAMNNLESVRKCMRIKRTPNDAGTKLTIEFTYYDNGFVSINGSSKGDHTPDEAERWLASSRFVMQMIEEFRNYINKSKISSAA